MIFFMILKLLHLVCGNPNPFYYFSLPFSYLSVLNKKILIDFCISNPITESWATSVNPPNKNTSQYDYNNIFLQQER